MHVFTYFHNCPHKDSSILHMETICLLAVVPFFDHHDLNCFHSSPQKMVPSNPVLTPELCQPVLCSCHSRF